ncbi:MAG: hypothetical protein COW01_01090 [Bdellovibrionales bacterium CG12_big_fil_rev_8_21_14_0_65_38_15]|nr:MAG: hypothetical protein COW79_05350 [Bdellovibrionales bacterium CG22_combo_CG10-13_8_21_14_all_38_13]PIQ57352.1 MAG: hypothetical protein COW01_01090 [Bdellovibrionales bacterium CG12_big_fil_rev_8_21_14_0_65_38_15]PIR28897.1 MAG: hypothetical protein COV38_13680 [Bdellovibrionales bacterium CG11_big_fil_rev_8_21_14_0_20_38_13]
MDIIVLGQCKKIFTDFAVFNFSGYWHSNKISQIRVCSEYDWIKNDDYILQLKVDCVEDKILWTKLVRAKTLSTISRL